MDMRCGARTCRDPLGRADVRTGRLL